MPENNFENLITMNSEGISSWEGSKSFLPQSLKNCAQLSEISSVNLVALFVFPTGYNKNV
jgi:hypothetical protein